jgi:ubiquinol-cytochrome c reductase cytochrome b subunit
MASRVLDWLDERTGWRAAKKTALDEPVAGGASWLYVFGSVLTFILGLQLVTGLMLAFYYAPSAQTAWASVAYIQDQITLGWFIRGLHSHGASAMVIVAGLHLVQVAVYGAYKKPREVNWLLGVLMLGLILAFALTGYLLPWDQKGYWATKVATGIMGQTPLVGGALQQAVQGGNEYGNLTLARFFALHVFVLPATLIGLVALHVALFRKHGVTPRWGRTPEDLAKTTAPFWPDQMARDMVAMVMALAALVMVTIHGRGVELGAPADPASGYDARPEWYFLPLFQSLKYFHGPLETVVALGAPAVVGGVLLSLPFLDRSADRAPRARMPALTALGVIFAAAATLMVLALRDDANDEALAKRSRAELELAREARTLALLGVPPGGGTSVFSQRPHGQAQALWNEHCGGCHDQAAGDDRKGPVIAPGYGSRAWIRSVLTEPDADHNFGRVKKVQAFSSKMKAARESGADLDALVEFVYGQSGAADVDARLAKLGKAIFDGGKCSDCHYDDGTSDDGEGPNLGGRGSLAWAVSFVANPGDARHFGPQNEMPVFGEKLEDDELAALAAYLIALRDETVR